MKNEILDMLKGVFRWTGKAAMKRAARALFIKLLKAKVIDGVVWLHEKAWDLFYKLTVLMPMKLYVKSCRKDGLDWRPGYVMTLGRTHEERLALSEVLGIRKEYETWWEHKDDMFYFERKNYQPTNPWQCYAN